jgi:hypothetical protein
MRKVANSEFRWECFPGTGGSTNQNVVTIYNCFDSVFLEIAERKGEFGEMGLFDMGVCLRKNRRTNDGHIR